jgi:hypothetical protein
MERILGVRSTYPIRGYVDARKLWHAIKARSVAQPDAEFQVASWRSQGLQELADAFELEIHRFFPGPGGIAC